MFAKESFSFAFYGVVLGLFIAVFGTYCLAFQHYGNFSVTALLGIQSETYLLWMLDTLPLMLGFLGRLIGEGQDQLKAQCETFEEKSISLQNSQVDLNSQLRNIMDQSANEVFIFRSEDFQLVQVSRGVIDNLGYSHKQLLKLKMFDLLPSFNQKKFEDLIHPLIHDEKKQVTLNAEFRHQKGSEDPVKIKFSLCTRGPRPLFLGYSMEVADHERYQNALVRERQKFFDILEKLPVAIHLQAPDYSVPYGNRLFRDRFGELGSKPCYSLMHNRTAPCEICQPFQVFNSQKEIISQWKAPDGSSYLTMCTPYHDIDNRALVMELAIDITEQENAKLEAIRAKVEAEKANKAKSEFLALMSHELRTPMNAILGFGQILEMDLKNLEASHAESVRQILAAGQHLLVLINDVLDLSAIDSGKIRMEMHPVLLEKIVHDLMRLLEPAAKIKEVTLNLCSDLDGLYVKTDGIRLKQVLLNLISNAIKYNRPGGKVDIAVQKTEGMRLRIDVADTGRGIPKDMMEKVFEPFSRLDPHPSEKNEGSGIGLSITKRLIELMEGTISLKSVYHKGSCFSIEIPLGDPDEKMTPVPDRSELLGKKDSGEKLRILYIEDNLANLGLVKNLFLKRDDFELLSAQNARLGMDMAIKERPDLILLDVHLPDQSGLSVFNFLRREETTANTPVIIVSADAMEDQVQKAMSLGVDAYLTKPIRFEDFWDTLNRVLEARKSSLT